MNPKYTTNSPIDRFRKNTLIDESSGCHIWKLHVNPKGYGWFKVNGKMTKCHRWIWAYFNGDIPDGLLVCHKCDNPRCVNPDHLFLGTVKDNRDDCMNKGRIRLTEEQKQLRESVAAMRFEKKKRPAYVKKKGRKLDKQSAAIVKARILGGEHYAIVAADYSISPSYAHAIGCGKGWKSLNE